MSSSESPAVSSASSGPAVLLISDVDDTVKITHVTRRFRAAVRGLVRRSVFGGMAVLYREMNPDLVFISGSPRFLHGRIRRTLVTRGGFPPARIVLRDWWAERDIVAFKDANIAATCRACSLPVVLVGDDAEHDPEVFVTAAARQDAGRVVAIYIRQNIGRPLPDGIVPFRTAFDIAVNEHRAGRLSAASALRVGAAVVEAAQTQARHLFPPFYDWPLRARAGLDPSPLDVAAPPPSAPPLAHMAAEVEAALR